MYREDSKRSVTADPPGDTISKAACPSQVIETLFFSLGDGVCATAPPPIAKATKRQTHFRRLFIPMPSLQVGAGRDRVSHVPSAPFRDLDSAFRKGARLSEIGICII